MKVLGEVVDDTENYERTGWAYGYPQFLFVKGFDGDKNVAEAVINVRCPDDVVALARLIALHPNANWWMNPMKDVIGHRWHLEHCTGQKG